MPVVYIDVLFLLNLVVDYFILLAVSALFHRRDKRWRLLLAAALGALYASLLFFPQLGFLYTAGLKLVFSAAVVAAAFRFGGWRGFLKLLLVFYAVSMLFAGVLYAVQLFFAPPGLMVRNGVGYLALSPLLLIGSGAACYIALSLFARLFHRRVHGEDLFDAQITAGGKTAHVAALMDTGNDLRDPISGLPVVIAEYRAVEALFPRGLRSFFRGGKNGGALPAEGCTEGWEKRVRMVPYASVGRGGVLPAFRPDRLAFRAHPVSAHAAAAHAETAGEEYTAEALVAVTTRRLSPEGEFAALLGPGLRGQTVPLQKAEAR